MRSELLGKNRLISSSMENTMHPSSEYTVTGKALLESQLAAFSAMTSILAEQVGQAFALTVAAAKASTEASVGAAKQSLTASDPQAVLALATALGTENAQRLTSYAGDLMNLRFSTRAELAKIVTAQVTNVQGEMHALYLRTSPGTHLPVGNACLRC